MLIKYANSRNAVRRRLPPHQCSAVYTSVLLESVYISEKSYERQTTSACIGSFVRIIVEPTLSGKCIIIQPWFDSWNKSIRSI